jgi:hypothetical protein
MSFEEAVAEMDEGLERSAAAAWVHIVEHLDGDDDRREAMVMVRRQIARARAVGLANLERTYDRAIVH